MHSAPNPSLVIDIGALITKAGFSGEEGPSVVFPSIPSTWSANVISSGKYSGWIGGSILASLSTFEKMCVTQEAYKEHGERILKAMFF